MIEEELQPKNELERAFAQARGLEPMRSWRRGTQDLHSGRMRTAVGNYLALARAYALEGKSVECTETLDCVLPYLKDFSSHEKFSVIRVLCCIMSEVEKTIPEIDNKDSVLTGLVKVAVSFTVQLKGDKLTVTDALSMIKKSSQYDVIADYQYSKHFEHLYDLIESYKSLQISDKPCNAKSDVDDLTENENLSDAVPQTKTETSDELLKKILDFAKNQAEPKSAIDSLSELAIYLLDKKEIEKADFICDQILMLKANLNKSCLISRPETSSIWSNLADKLCVRDQKAKASEFFYEAIIERISANNFKQISITELFEISLHALTSKEYEYWSEKFHNIRAFLELQRTQNFEYETLCAETIALHHLILELCHSETNIDLQALISLKKLVDYCRKASGSPFFVDILPYVAELLNSRVDKRNVVGMFDLLWAGSYESPTVKIFDTYIQPLSLVTEQVLGSATPQAFHYYAKIFDQMKKARLEDKQLAVFWRVLIAMRESTDGHNSPSLLPLLASLATQYYEAHAFRDCLDVIERVQMMDLTDLSGINCGIVTIPGYMNALLTLARLNLCIPAENQRAEIFMDLVEKIIRANKSFKEVDEENYKFLCEHVFKISTMGPSSRAKELLPLIDKLM